MRTRNAEGGTRNCLTRREAVELLATMPVAFAPTPALIQHIARLSEPVRAQQGYSPKFFTTHEWETVRALVDILIPKDARSGSATDAGVPEFMDFWMIEDTDNQGWMRGGLGWLDIECQERFSKNFIDCQAAQRSAVLDDIAWPDRAKPTMSHGVAFFNRFRDLTASGFYTSRIGIEDLQYMGNTFVSEWTGCPPDQLRKLGVG
jgi:hypothetical protein